MAFFDTDVNARFIDTPGAIHLLSSLSWPSYQTIPLDIKQFVNFMCCSFGCSCIVGVRSCTLHSVPPNSLYQLIVTPTTGFGSYILSLCSTRLIDNIVTAYLPARSPRNVLVLDWASSNFHIFVTSCGWGPVSWFVSTLIDAYLGFKLASPECSKPWRLSGDISDATSLSS